MQRLRVDHGEEWRLLQMSELRDDEWVLVRQLRHVKRAARRPPVFFLRCRVRACNQLFLFQVRYGEIAHHHNNSRGR